MSIQTQMKEEMKEALKAGDQTRLSVIRGLISSFTNELVTKGKKPTEELADEEAMAVIKRAARQRKDSIEQFKSGGREDLAAKEAEELAILEKYLPEQMSAEEIKKIAEAKKAELGITDKSGMGQLMGAVMKETGGQAEGGDVKKVIEEILS